jgi:predicted PurR-regulated permease PerM
VPRRFDAPFTVLLIAVSLAFLWILGPFYGAVLWATIIAIVFAPIHRRVMLALGQRRNLAALATLVIVVVVVIAPLTLVAGLLLEEAVAVYQRIRSGELNFGRYFEQIVQAMPGWAAGLLDRFGLTELRDVQARLSEGLMRSSQFIATQAIAIGQNTFDFIVSLFIMLYLLFFLLRDGDALSRLIVRAIPLRTEQQHALFVKFTVVVRATVKGNIVVAIIQGVLGGLIFSFLGIHASILWGTLMAVLSLLPAVGAGLVWLPVAVYFLAVGAIWQGVLLIAYGVLVIGLVDNVVRPILVGQDTKMPDYVVLISTLGGIATFGLNGFVIGPLIAAMFMAAWEISVASRSEIAVPP